jgi:OmpR family two-component system response regulator YxdJ
MQKIMIVEDEPKIAQHLQYYIQKYGYDPVVVTQKLLPYPLFLSQLGKLYLNVPKFKLEMRF